MYKHFTIGNTQKSSLEERALEDDRHPLIRATDLYFEPKSFEKSGRLYSFLGIKYFKKLLMSTVGKAYRRRGADNVPGLYFIGRGYEQDIGNYECYTRLSESIHTLGNIPLCLTLVSDITSGNSKKAVLDGVGILINTYCAMLQRYNRVKAYRVLEKREER